MGLYWPREYINIPKRQLLGSRTRKGRAGVVNFWSQRGIYVLYRDFDMVYVGQAADRGLGVRLAEHTRDEIAERWDRFSWFGFGLVTERRRLREVPTRFHVDRNVALNHFENMLVEAAEPRLNRQGGRWGKSVTLFHPASINEKGDSEGVGAGSGSTA